MPRIAYVNGAYVPQNEAYVSIEDRGFQFADSIYEVIGCINGQMIDDRGHLDRLERSLKELKISMPVSRDVLSFILKHIIRTNHFKNAALYIQISRGTAKRNFKFPSKDTTPSLIIYGWPHDFTLKSENINGISVCTSPDQRWARRNIKTTQLLAQSLAKQDAIDKGFQDAWMLDENGNINEASASNVWILKGRTLYTHSADQMILKGVTRTAVSHVIESLQLIIEEKTFTPKEALAADEAFQTSATALVVPVISVDGKPVGNGKVGPVTRQILDAYITYTQQQEAIPWKA